MAQQPGRPRHTTIDRRIRQAGMEILANNGYTGLTMTEVARRAGTVPATLYRRYPNKEALVEDIIRREFAEMAVEFPPIPNTLEGDVAAYVDTLRANFSAERLGVLAGLLPSLFDGSGAAGAVAATVRDGLRELGRTSWSTLVTRAVERGDISTPPAAFLADQVGPALLMHHVLVLGGSFDEATMSGLKKIVSLALTRS